MTPEPRNTSSGTNGARPGEHRAWAESEQITVTETLDLSPLELERSDNLLRFTFSEQVDILPELPADYELLLTNKLAPILAEQTELSAEISLRGLAAISSRQLGSLIALQKVLRPRFGKLPLTNASDGVRHLLDLTRTNQLFELR